MQSIALSIHFLPDHTAIVIAEVLEEILQEWNLNSEKQMSLTTDSGANVVAAANLLNCIRISCFGTLLSQIKALNNDVHCSRALGVALKIVNAFLFSWKRKRELMKAQINLKLRQHSLVTDCRLCHTVGLNVKDDCKTA